MKKIVLIMAMCLTGSVFAQQVGVNRQELGSGTPGTTGSEQATRWSNDIYHAPQYMPGYPTAAVLYPRVVDVECVKSTSGLNCKGYNWYPELGRGEYLMIRPVVRVEQAPKVITNTVTVPGPERIIIKEVPEKKKAE